MDNENLIGLVLQHQEVLLQHKRFIEEQHEQIIKLTQALNEGTDQINRLTKIIYSDIEEEEQECYTLH